jgi:hypothetical protein
VLTVVRDHDVPSARRRQRIHEVGVGRHGAAHDARGEDEAREAASIEAVLGSLRGNGAVRA